MFCTKCGKRLKEGARYCSGCGAPSRSAAEPGFRPPIGGSPVQSQPPKAQPPSGKLRRRRGGVAAVAAAVCAVLVLVVGASVLGGILPGGSSGVVVSPEEAFTDEMFYSLPEEGHVAVDNGTGLVYADNEVLLYAEESAGQAEIEQLVVNMGGEIVGRIAETRSYQVCFEDAMEYGELERLVSQIEDNELVSAAFPNYAMEIDVDASEGNPTDDPAWDNEDEMWGYEAINLEEAWNLVTADPSIVVGVSDNQFYSDHEDLSFASVVGYEFDSALASASHGTHVAGTIAADANGKGSVGVAYGCTLVGISYSLSDGYGTPAEGYEWAYGYEFDVTYLAAVEGARVVNCSTGCNDLTFCASHGNEQAQAVLALQAEHQAAFLEALVAGGHDFVICKSAGNSNVAEYIRIDEVVTIGDDVYSWGFLPKDADTESYWSALSDEELKSRLVAGDTDANYDILGAIADPDVASRIIIVGAADRSAGGYAVASYSNGGSRVDVVAPGGESSGIYSSVAEKGLFGSLRSGYDYSCGTSMAAPMVSGVAALVYSANPDLTGDEVKDIICSTASGSYQSSGSFSDTYGLLDAEAAVKKALSYSKTDDILKTKLASFISEYGEFDEYQTGTKTTAYDVWLDCEGILGASIEDFDSDGSVEMLICIPELWKESDSFTYYRISLCMYEAVEGEAVLVDSVYLGAYLGDDWREVYGENGRNDAFLEDCQMLEQFTEVDALSVGDELYIACQDATRSGGFSDGAYQSYWILEYTGQSFQYVGSFTQPGEGSTDFGFYGYTFENGVCSSKSLYYCDDSALQDYDGGHEGRLYDDFFTALKSFFSQYGINVDGSLTYSSDWRSAKMGSVFSGVNDARIVFGFANELVNLTYDSGSNSYRVDYAATVTRGNDLLE